MMKPTDSDLLTFTLSAREIKKRFCKVYGNVILNYFEFNEDLISDANAILNSKKERKQFKNDLPDYQLAFLLSFGVQDTCTAARKFYESIKNRTEVIKKLSKNNPIKLLCIESESLPVVMGVCQVLNEIVKQFASEGKFDFTEIRVLIIDNRVQWRYLCEFIIDMVNSYFTNIELKHYFVEDFISSSPEEFADVIKEFDLMIVARVFAEDRCFTENYNFMKIILNEMKEDSVLFYFDSCNERYYANLKHLISKTSFSELQSSENLHVLFEDLVDEQYNLDLPVSWDTDFQPVMISTWIKAAVHRTSSQEVAKPIASNQLNSIKSTVKSNNKGILNGHISHPKLAKTSTGGKTNVINGKKKVTSSKKQRNQSDSSSGQTNVVSGKQRVKSSIKYCSSVIATPKAVKSSVSKAGNESHAQKTHEVLSTLISILNKHASNSKATKSSQNPQCSNVSCGAAISQKVKGQAANTSTGKMIATDQKNKTDLSRKGNASSVMKTGIPQKKKEAKSSEKSSKTNINSKSTASKEEFKTKSNNKKTTTTPEVQSAFPVDLPKKLTNKNATLTKKSNKNIATEKVKLTGKFAYMDLEKRNKDEQHKMKAKKASFAKHANFDYDD